MKKFFKILGYVTGGFLVMLYLAFLFVLPKALNLNTYKSEVQKFVKENSGLTIDFDKVDVITTPLLEAGIKTKNIKVKLPDNSELFSADSLKGKVFLPSLIWLSIRVTGVEVVNPHVQIDIQDSEQFKVAHVFEDIVNKKRQDKLAHPEKYEKTDEVVLPFDPAKIKVNIPSFKLKNYSAVVDDVKAGHKLTLKGEELRLGYYNGRTAKIKTDAHFYSDETENINVNIDIDSSLPRFILPEAQEEDNEAVFVIPFVNPVEVYRDYNLKSNVSSKLKIRKVRRSNHIKMNGFFNVEDTTLTLSGLQLPKSYFRLNSKGYKTDIDTNLFITDKEFINIFGKFNHGKKPTLDLSVSSPKVQLQNVLNIAKAYLNTIHIKNDIDNMSASGYFMADAAVKTNFKKMNSYGHIIVRDGNITNKNLGVLFNDIKLNLIFDDDALNIKNSHILINQKPLDISGSMSYNNGVDLSIKGENIPLSGLYKSFAPKEIKNNYDLLSGNFSIDANIEGDMNSPIGVLKFDLNKFLFAHKSRNFILSNDLAHFSLVAFIDTIKGRLLNKGFELSIPVANTRLRDNYLTVDISNDKILLNPSQILFNNKSLINFAGVLENYLSNYEMKATAEGAIASSDLGTVLGEVALPYFDVKGAMPLRAKFEAKDNKMKFAAQVKADSSNYISPVVMQDFYGKQTIAQLNIEKNRDTVKIDKTGLFTRSANAEFTQSLPRNLWFSNEIVGVKSIVSNLSFKPVINLFKVYFAHDLDGSLYILQNSRFSFNGKIHAYGEPSAPKIDGKFIIKDFTIPEIYTKIGRIFADINSRDLKFFVDNINVNNSDFKIGAKTNWDLLSQLTLYDVNVYSRFIDVNKVLRVSQNIAALFPTSEQNRQKLGIEERTDIPITILNGRVNLKKIVLDNIKVNDTTGNISLFKNIFYIKNLRTYPLGGTVSGKASMHLIDNELKAQVSGKKFDIKKILLDVMNMKDMLTGDMNFKADISMKGTELEQQMKTLKGYVDFNIKDGQLGPFGKIENFIMAENIRENQFFSSTIGSVINNLLSFNTSRYNSLYGHLNFHNGIAEISPIKSQGDVMSMFIFGNLNLLDSTAEMKIRGKLASAFSDKLGPLANLNPINLVKSTPGLNVVMVKAFALFCEEISEEEMKAIPHLGEGKSDENATKFQVRLKGDTRKPLKMIKSFKWLALDSEIQTAKEFVDTIPTPEEGEEGLSVQQLIELRQQQAQAQAELEAKEAKKPINRLKKLFHSEKKENEK